MVMTDDDSWKAWSKYVLAQLEQYDAKLEKCVACREDVLERIAKVKRELAVLAVKVTLICAGLSIAVSVAIKFLVK